MYQAGETIEYIAYLYEVETSAGSDAINFCKAA